MVAELCLREPRLIVCIQIKSTEKIMPEDWNCMNGRTLRVGVLQNFAGEKTPLNCYRR